MTIIPYQAAALGAVKATSRPHQRCRSCVLTANKHTTHCFYSILPSALDYLLGERKKKEPRIQTLSGSVGVAVGGESRHRARDARTEARRGSGARSASTVAFAPLLGDRPYTPGATHQARTRLGPPVFFFFFSFASARARH